MQRYKVYLKVPNNIERKNWGRFSDRGQSVALQSLFESVALQSLTEVRVWLRNLDDPIDHGTVLFYVANQIIGPSFSIV